MTRLRSILAVLGLLAATTLVGACNQGSVFNLKVGDCFDDESSNSTGVSDVPVVDCADPHDNEVYADTELPDGSYPGEASISETGDEFCLNEFEGYVGKDYYESVLRISYFLPSTQSWADGDRLITCYAYQLETKTEGTIKGSGI